MGEAPPLPFLPAERHGKEIVALALCYVDDPHEGKTLIEALRGFGTVLGEHMGVQPYIAWQQAFDPLLVKGGVNYWKSHNFYANQRRRYRCYYRIRGQITVTSL